VPRTGRPGACPQAGAAARAPARALLGLIQSRRFARVRTHRARFACGSVSHTAPGLAPRLLPSAAIFRAQPIDRGSERDANDHGSLWYRVVALTWSGAHQQALQAGRVFLLRFGEAAEICPWMGVSSAALGDAKPARVILERAVRLGQDGGHAVVDPGAMYRESASRDVSSRCRIPASWRSPLASRPVHTILGSGALWPPRSSSSRIRRAARRRSRGPGWLASLASRGPVRRPFSRWPPWRGETSRRPAPSLRPARDPTTSGTTGPWRFGPPTGEGSFAEGEFGDSGSRTSSMNCVAWRKGFGRSGVNAMPDSFAGLSRRRSCP